MRTVRLLGVAFLCQLGQAHAVDITVDPAREQRPISPYVYGANEHSELVAHPAERLGGNRFTGYNWETNASSAGSDWQHTNDFWMCSALGASEEQCRAPAGVISHFFERAQQHDAYTLVTLQMAGYVAADGDGSVGEDQAAPSARWLPVEFAKGSALSASPDLADGVVYMDELVSHLVARHGTADNGGVRGYSLDNEPDLWASTHPRIHPDKVGALELVERSVALSTAIKGVDPSAEVFGYASYGYSGYVSLQDAPDWEAERGQSAWYVEYYLREMKAASDAAGVRLLDVLDLHYYSEARGGPGASEEERQRITEGAEENALSRVHATRSLWDPSYGYALDPLVGEASWICHWTSDCPLRVVPRVLELIDEHYPGTKLAISEYDFGAKDHVSGGLAQADALGVFAREGVYFASRWGELGVYTSAAFQLFLDYDGSGSRFGDLLVASESSDGANVPVYAALSSADERELHVVVLNRSSTAQPATISVADPAYARARVWGFGPERAEVTELASASVEGGAFGYELPAMSALHFVLVPESPAGAGGAGASGGEDGESGAGPSDPVTTPVQRSSSSACSLERSSRSSGGAAFALLAVLAVLRLRRRRVRRDDR